MKLTKYILILPCILFAVFLFKHNSSPPNNTQYVYKNHYSTNEKVTLDTNVKKNNTNNVMKKSKNLIVNTKKKNHHSTKIIKLGCKGSDVLNLQKKLNKFKYNLNEDGIFGESTYFALCNFQLKNNINNDGIVGPSTIKKLNLMPTKKTIYNPKKNIYKTNFKKRNLTNIYKYKNFNSPTPYYILVKSKHRKVYIFKRDNNKWNLISSMLCTIGKPSTPTIKGTFNIKNKGYSFIVKNNPKLMCKYYTQIQGNYLFHSILLDRKGNIANGSLGTASSHGCIRLSLKNAKYIYDNIPKYTTVCIN